MRVVSITPTSYDSLLITACWASPAAAVYF